MKDKKELSYRDLKMICDTKVFDFETTQELEEINDGIKSVNDVNKVLESKDRTKLGKKALPNGLYLEEVIYDE